MERLLSEPVDAERVVVVDDGALEVRAGVIVAQALHHGNAHREQICAILTSLGIEPRTSSLGVRVGDRADLGTNRCPLTTGIGPGLVAADPWLMSRSLSPDGRR